MRHVSERDGVGSERPSVSDHPGRDKRNFFSSSSLVSYWRRPSSSGLCETVSLWLLGCKSYGLCQEPKRGFWSEPVRSIRQPDLRRGKKLWFLPQKS